MIRQQLIEQIFKKQSYLCVGLDTDITKIPKHLLSQADPVLEFNKQIIDATKDLCVSYKINTAFYEARGAKGWETLEKTVNYIPQEHFKIADAKRGDIGNTSSQYAKAFFETLDFDAITIAPYMGEDSVKPFLEYEGKWAIILGLTSNAGAEDFELQKFVTKTDSLDEGIHIEKHDTKFLYEMVLEKVSKWGTPDNLMFVIGATQPNEFENIRRITPEHFYLVPGIGAQGGNLKEISEKAMINDCGILVNVSRAIIYASDKKNFSEEAKIIAQQYQSEMKDYLNSIELKKICGVNQIFHTSWGLTVFLDFSKDVMPRVGMVLKNSSERKWKIIGMSMGKPIELMNVEFVPRFNDWIIDCVLEPIEHSDSLNEKDILKVD